MRKMICALILGCLAFSFAQEVGAKYLVITHDNFYDAILPFAQWKHKKGMVTKVVKLSETGSDSSQIRNYIRGYPHLPSDKRDDKCPSKRYDYK